MLKAVLNCEWKLFFKIISVVTICIVLFSSFFSYGFFHYDEHYQIIEFCGYKLGKTTADALPWEFSAKIRQWIQPGLYYIITKALFIININNPFVLTFFFRLITGLINALAIILLTHSGTKLFPDSIEKRKLMAILLNFLFFIPYLSVRTSSESTSGALLAIGIALMLIFSKKDHKYYTFSNLLIFLSGIIFGFAFQFRFQVAFVIIGIGLWTLFFSNKNIPVSFVKCVIMFLGFLIPFGLGVLIDYWGYGEWTLTPLNYFYSNLVSKVSEHFGVSPFWAYITDSFLNFFFPIMIFITFSVILFWIKRPLSLFTFITLPFVLAHSAIPHKELRFLFPIILFLPYIIIEAYNPDNFKLKFLKRIWDYRYSFSVKLFFIINILYLLATILFVPRFDLPMQKYIYKNRDKINILYCFNTNPYDNYGVEMNFYKPEGLQIHYFEDENKIFDLINDSSDTYFVSNGRNKSIENNENFVWVILHKKFPDFMRFELLSEKLLNERQKLKLRNYVLYKIRYKP